MRNIELKCRRASLASDRQIAQRVATSHLGRWRQIDTYFHCPRGRLKLRESLGRTAELIAYHRADVADSRGSDYMLVPVANPQTLKQALAATLGIQVVVDKRRDVFLHHNVRIHLDEVAGLGTFLEFEAVLSSEIDEAAGTAQLDFLRGEFQIEPDQIVGGSYSDLLVAQTPNDPE